MTSDLNALIESNISNRPYRPSWSTVWMRVADTIGQRSRCDRAQVGAVIVDQDWNVLAAAYNGPAPGWRDDMDGASRCSEWCPRAQGIGGTSPDYSNCPSNHAEINALARMTPTTKNTYAYVNRLCCITCAKALAAAGICMVVCKSTDIDGHIDTAQIKEYFDECGVEFWIVNATAE